MSASAKKLALIAVGGNSLILDPKKTSSRDQYAAAVETCRHIAALIERGYRVVVTHGNGPQVGFILRRSELARAEISEQPLDACGAESQGSIGYQLQMALQNELSRRPGSPTVATVITQTVVDRNDPSWAHPTKPIGSFMTKEQAEEHQALDGWHVVEDSGRGYRRVVPSPQPRRIVELDAIRALLDSGAIVIAAGGGGIPVTEEPNGHLVGAEAVIDKDLASSLLARELKADLFVISTAVKQVCIDFKKPGERAIDRMTVAEARRHLGEGQFAPGSMKPKIEAVIQFLEGGGGEALITDPPNLIDAFAGKTGTRVVP